MNFEQSSDTEESEPFAVSRRYRRPATFRQSDVARVLRAAKQAGGGFDVRLSPDGEIVIREAESASPLSARKTPPVREFSL